MGRLDLESDMTTEFRIWFVESEALKKGNNFGCHLYAQIRWIKDGISNQNHSHQVVIRLITPKKSWMQIYGNGRKNHLLPKMKWTAASFKVILGIT